MASKLRVPVEVFENNFEFLVEQIDVAALQKHLHGQLQLLDSEAETILNSEDFPAVEKSGYLVQRAISLGSRGVNELIKLLEAEQAHVGHSRVLSKLQTDSQEYAKRYSPVLFVLDDIAEELPLGIDVRLLQVSLMKTGIISAKDIHGFGNRSMRDRMTNLITAVKENGVDGLVKLLQSLEQIKQTEFAESLRKRVQSIVDEGCELNEEDSKILEDAKFRVRAPIKPLLDVSSSSSTEPTQVQKPREVQHDSESDYRERVVVTISMTKFLELSDDEEEMNEKDFNGDYQVSESLESIRKMLKQMKFTVVDLGPMLADLWHKKKVDRLRSIVAAFENNVSVWCSSTCQVVILIAGIAFSHKDQKTRLLVEHSPMFSKHVGDCISEEELKSCLDTLSTPYVTVIADNHIEIEQMSQNTSQQYISLWKNLCANIPQRVVISYCYKAMQKQVRMEQLFGLIMNALVHFLTYASENLERAHISHRQLCDMLSLFCSYKLGTDCNIRPCVQGDVDRGLFGNNNYPYLLYFPVHIQMSALAPISFEVKHINVPYGEMLGLTDKSNVKIGHMCRPTELVSCNVFDLQPFSCKVDVDEVEKLLQLLKDIYDTMFEGIDHSSRENFHILLVYPSFDSTSSQRSPVAVDCPGPEQELRDYIRNQSQLLRLTADTGKAVLKVSKRGDEYIIKDGWGDIKIKSQVANMEQVKSFLEIYARFKLVKMILKSSPDQRHASRQTCVLYQYKPSPLLTLARYQTKEFTHPAASMNLSKNTDGFWYLETNSSIVDVYFSKVRLINSIEVKGDSEYDISFEKIEYRSKCSLVKDQFEVPSNETSFDLRRKGKSDIVSAQYLRLLIVAQEEACERCGMAFRVTHKNIQPICMLKRMQLLNYRELINAGYIIEPNNNGGIKLGDGEWVVIIAPQKMSHIPLEFDFCDNHNLESLELKYPSYLSADNVQPVKEVRIECFPKGTNSRLPTNTIFSTTTFDFRNPVRASHLRLVPKNRTSQKMCIQLQVYGNQSCVGEDLIVNEGDDIQVGFAYSYDHNVYLNIVCMEETGMVSSVLSMKKLSECPKSEIGILGWLEDHSEFIHTFIPDNYPLRGSEIRDTYKIISSSQPFDLHPLCQAGANDYYSPHILDLASVNSNVVKDSAEYIDEPWWYENEALVRVQRRQD